MNMQISFLLALNVFQKQTYCQSYLISIFYKQMLNNRRNPVGESKDFSFNNLVNKLEKRNFKQNSFLYLKGQSDREPGRVVILLHEPGLHLDEQFLH
jgi:hypothetical protein